MIDKIKNVPLLWLLVQLQSISKLNASGYLLSEKKKRRRIWIPLFESLFQRGHLMDAKAMGQNRYCSL